jgi:cobyrinic acid a,c-diamide synthase
MAAFRRRGLQVQGFKVGPDYIDPGYHAVVTGRVSHNLDSWMSGPEGVREVMERSSRSADLCVIEGVMGYYDGKDVESNQGSAAEVAELTASPVILVVDIAGMARSAAAVVRGFQAMDAQRRIAAVLVNRAGSPGHYQMVRRAIESITNIPVCGYLQSDKSIIMPERHLGLLPAIGRGELSWLWERLAMTVESTVELDRLLAIARDAGPLPTPAHRKFTDNPVRPTAKLAIARDAAFNFYYPENLDLLVDAGLDIEEFSPLAGEPLPENADALYLGGGFPEEFLQELSQPHYLAALGRELDKGLPTVAECGGYMYLGPSIANHEGQAYPMLGRIPMKATLQDHLAALGYREIEALHDSPVMVEGQRSRGHEFHYSTQEFETANISSAYRLSGRLGSKEDGVARSQLAAGYVHLYFLSNPSLAPRFAAAARQYRILRKKEGY